MPLKGVTYLLGDFGGRLVEEVTRRCLEQRVIIGRDADLDGRVDAHVDVVVGGNEVRGLSVDGDHRGGHGVHALEEGNLPPRLAVEDALAARAGNDLDFARGSGDEACPQEEGDEDECSDDECRDGYERHDWCFQVRGATRSWVAPRNWSE